jgi:hypothetical protein
VIFGMQLLAMQAVKRRRELRAWDNRGTAACEYRPAYIGSSKTREIHGWLSTKLTTARQFGLWRRRQHTVEGAKTLVITIH